MKSLDKKNKVKENKYLSKCCNAPTYVNYGDEGTNCFMCSKCNKPCDVDFDQNTKPNIRQLIKDFDKDFAKNVPGYHTPESLTELLEQNSAHWNYPEETELLVIGKPNSSKLIKSEEKNKQLLKDEEIETTAKGGSQRPNKDKSYSCLSDTAQADLYKEVDEKFNCLKCIFAIDSDDGFVLGEDGIVYDMNRVLKFIHKLIDNNNKEWVRKIKAIENISDFADSGDTLKKRIINNLLK